MNNKEIKEFADGYAEAWISIGKLFKDDKPGFVKGFCEAWNIKDNPAFK